MENIKLIKSKILKPGECLFFGPRYEDSSCCIEAIEWTILEVDTEGRKILVIPQMEIGISRYSDGDISWDNSELKRWLNEEYIQVFSKEEQDAIVETPEGKIFLLTVNQYNEYKKFEDLICSYLMPDNNKLFYVGYCGCEENVDPSESRYVRPAFWISFDYLNVSLFSKK